MPIDELILSVVIVSSFLFVLLLFTEDWEDRHGSST